MACNILESREWLLVERVGERYLNACFLVEGGW